MFINPNDALIVVDVQNDFCPNGALAVKDGDSIIGTINRLMPQFSQVVLTQDWHTPDHISFAATHQLPPLSTIQVSYGTQILWPTHCVQGTNGAVLHPDLSQTHATLILKKGYHANIDSYSAFVQADGSPTGLTGFLKERNIKRVFVVGLATDFCVAWTAIDATKHFDCVVLLDACQAIDVDNSLSQAIENMNQSGVQFGQACDMISV